MTAQDGEGRPDGDPDGPLQPTEYTDHDTPAGDLGTVRDAALAYARSGLRVVPCKPGLKAADPRFARRGVHDATADEETIAAWFRAEPALNIGIALGHGLIVVDIDGLEQEEALKRLVAEHGGDWPRETARSRSGSKEYEGRHLWLTAPAGTHGCKLDSASELQVRGVGQYVVVPPSIHPSGARYAWERDLTNVEAAPAWLLALMAEKTMPVSVPGGIIAPLETLDLPPEMARDAELIRAVEYARLADVGQRSDRLFALGCACWRAAGRAGIAIEPAVVAGLAKGVDFRMASPKYKGRADADEQAWAIATKTQEAVSVDAEASGPSLRSGTAQGAGGPVIISAAELQNLILPEVRMVTELLPEGVVLTVGPPKIGKSWFVLGEAIEVAKRGNPVLVIFLEDGRRRVQDRLRTLLGQQPWPACLQIATEWRRFDAGGLDDLGEWLDANPDAALVVVDVFARARGRARRNEDRYEADYGAIAAINALTKSHPGVCINVVHHTRKMDAADPLDMVSGTQGLAGASDAVRVLKRARGQSDATLFVMGRDVEEQEVALSFAGGRWIVLGDAAALRISNERREILGILQEEHTPLSPKEIAARMPLKKKDGAIRGLLRKMLDDGEVKCPERGKYIPAVYLLDTFRHQDPPSV
jgi:hypothetical protein